MLIRILRVQQPKILASQVISLKNVGNFIEDEIKVFDAHIWKEQYIRYFPMEFQLFRRTCPSTEEKKESKRNSSLRKKLKYLNFFCFFFLWISFY